MKSEKIITKAMVLAISVLFLVAMSTVCIASTTTYSVPIGTGVEDLADNNLASAYTQEFATGYTGSVDEWSEDIRLTTDSAWSGYPAIAVDTNNNVHITSCDSMDGNLEIYYTKLDNNGTTLVDDTRLTTDSASSIFPAIAVDTNNNVHITWDDDRDGNSEIYYKHSITGFCTAEYAVHQAGVSNPDRFLNPLRERRDNHLKDEYVDRYYDYSPELTRAIARNPALTFKAARLLVKYSPMIRRQVHGISGDRLITKRDVEEIVSFTDRLQRSVLEDRNEIDAERSQRVVEFIDEFTEQVKASEGKTFSEALQDSIYYRDEQMPN